MAQHDYSITDQNGASFRSDLNSALSAIVSNNSGVTEPSTTYAYQWWADTTAGILKRRNAANDAWISVMSLTTGLIIGADVQAYNANNALLSDIQSGASKSAVASGTVDAITATFTPAPTLTDMMQFNVRASGANTVAGVTFNPNSLGALTVYKTGGTALDVGDIAGAGHELVLRYRSSPARYELLNPSKAGVDATSPYAAIGWNQTWQNVTASRAVATTYTNTSGKAIVVAIIYSTGVTNYFSIDGVDVIRVVSTGNNNPLTVVVPNSSTYRLAGGTIERWMELR